MRGFQMDPDEFELPDIVDDCVVLCPCLQACTFMLGINICVLPSIVSVNSIRSCVAVGIGRNLISPVDGTGVLLINGVQAT